MTYADRMKEIEAREFNASIGPWHVRANNAYHISYILRSGVGNKIAQFFNWQDVGFDVNSERNAIFCAHARTDIPYLLSRVKELESALGEAMRTMRDDADVFNRLTAIKEGRQ